ncbi:S-layer homology domain-containing protein [Anoxynatronum sibiricum]|uniref:S-layer homology domain-containing protein n=1 Tax=Anoxynatronum sibiricum TaxID=210623 RepID=A0ABU9VWS9_9CLOT
MNSKTKKILAMILIVVMISPTVVFGEGNSKDDLQGHWAEKNMRQWIAGGWMKGYPDGSYRPDGKITRAEFITLINKLYGYDATTEENYEDIEKESWYHQATAIAKHNKYFDWYKEDKLYPNQPITRQEAAAVITQILKLNASEDLTAIERFNDKETVPTWSRSYMDAVVKGGYVSGYPDATLRPAGDITRAEAVVMLDKVVGELISRKGIYGTAEETKTIKGNVTISAQQAALKNMVIEGDLILAAAIGDGDVTLENITVKGKTIVYGGGPNSIILIDFNGSQIIIDLPDNSAVRLVAYGDTHVGEVVAYSDAILEEAQSLTEDGFTTINIYQGAAITLIGAFESVNIGAGNATLHMQTGSINTLVVEEAAADAMINLSNGTTVTHLNIHAPTQVTGSGNIETAQINSNDVMIAPVPSIINIGEGITSRVGGKTVNRSTTITTTITTGGGGSGGNSGNNSGGGNSGGDSGTPDDNGGGSIPNNPPKVVQPVQDINNAALGIQLTVDLRNTFEDKDGDPLIISTNLGKVENGIWSYTPTASGTMTVVITAADGKGGSATTTFKVTVTAVTDPTNNPPTVTSTVYAISDAFVGIEIMVDLSNVFEDIDGDPLTLSANVGTIDNEVWRYTPTIAEARTVVITATDGRGGSATTSFLVTTLTIEITEIIVTSAGDITEIEEGNTLQMRAAVSPANASNQEILWSVDAMTGTATIDEDGLLTATTAGTVNVRATAKHHSSVTGSKIITIHPDNTPPAPGDGGMLTISEVKTDGMKLSWTKAADDKTAVSQLEYAAYHSETNNISTVAEMEANGTPAGDYTADIDSIVISGLEADTHYYVNVIVRDQSGNKAAYTMTSEKTFEYELYYASYTENAIEKLGITTGEKTTVVSQVDDSPYSGPQAITVAGGRVYWAGQDSQKIESANLNGSDRRTLVNTGISNVTGIAVDPINGWVYWGDYGNNAIKRTNIDGTEVSTIISQADRSTATYKGPFALAISGDKLYWVGDSSLVIERSHLDGSERETVIATTGSPQSVDTIAIDQSNGKVYWSDYDNNQINNANLDGTGKEAVVSTADEGSSYPGVKRIAITKERLYWITDSTGTIYSSKLDGSDRKLFWTPSSSSVIKGFVIVDPGQL